jgi:hypothetical protein
MIILCCILVLFVYFSAIKGYDCWQQATYKNRIHNHEYDPKDNYEHLIWRWRQSKSKEMFKEDLKDFD